jgi:dienelactone hydrolase
MSYRNLSGQCFFEQWARRHRPSHAFAGTTRDDWEAWRGQTRPAVLDTLGEFPERVDPRPELLADWEREGVRTEKWLIDVQEGLAATLLLCVPNDIGPAGKRPAILAWHGHGPFGKEPVMGNDSSPELRDNIHRHNYDYGWRMAQRGYVTYAIDWMGCGERNESTKPQHRMAPGPRDWCNLYYLHATMLGTTPIAMNVTHGMAATTFVSSLPFVDPERIGVMGLSGGGTMTLWTALCDGRMKAAEIICYSDLWAHFGYRDLNYCGMQVAPGLFRLVDLPDLQGLLAPLPLLVDIGANDTCFKVETAMACYRQVERVYTAAGARDRLELDLHPGEHGWGDRGSSTFFARHLGRD